MKKTEFLQEMRSKSDSEIQTAKEDLLRELFNLRMRKGTDSLKKNHVFKKIKTDIARVNTVLSQRNKKYE